ncbi:MAG: Lsr2 family protein [Gordonia sp. (in: high G+C Gram-positive bacteria)]
MARTTVIQYVDDLDGKPLKDAITISFSIDGESYEFDTSPSHAKEFHKDLEKYVEASRSAAPEPAPVKPARRRRKPAAPDTKVVREWAREAGYEVSERGRISADIIAAYEAAN